MLQISSNISNTGKSVSSDVQTLRGGLKKKKKQARLGLLRNSEVFRYLMERQDFSAGDGWRVAVDGWRVTGGG